MNNKTIAIFIILGLIFGVILSTVHHFTSERPEPQNLDNIIIEVECQCQEGYVMNDSILTSNCEDLECVLE